MAAAQKRVFDLHCDTVTDGLQRGYGLGGNGAHVDLLRPPEGFGWCQTFAVYIPDELRGQPAWDYFEKNQAFFQSELAKNQSVVRQVKTSGEIEAALAEGKVAAILSVEGGCVLMGEPDRVEKLADYGVKFLTLTWNGANELAGGRDSDMGLTPIGKAVLARMEEAGVVADVSHLNDRSFWDVARAARKPFVATHSDSRKICPHGRNLTDDQYRVMIEIGGVVGLNLCTEFLTEKGILNPEDVREHRRVALPGIAAPEDLLAHILHFLELGGEDVVCMGSDFDGCTVPDFIPGAFAYPALEQLFLDAGLGKTLTHKILFQNAFDFLVRYESMA